MSEVLLFSWSSVDFFSNGFTRAYFIESGTKHEENDVLTMGHSVGSRISRYDLSAVVAIRSRGQHFEFEDMIIFLSPSSFVYLSFFKFGIDGVEYE